jgi:hypothetical protein
MLEGVMCVIIPLANPLNNVENMLNLDKLFEEKKRTGLSIKSYWDGSLVPGGNKLGAVTLNFKVTFSTFGM